MALSSRQFGKYVWDVDYAHSKDTLKTGEIKGGIRRVHTIGEGETDSRQTAEQMVASYKLGHFFHTQDAGGNEPTQAHLHDFPYEH